MESGKLGEDEGDALIADGRRLLILWDRYREIVEARVERARAAGQADLGVGAEQATGAGLQPDSSGRLQTRPASVDSGVSIEGDPGPLREALENARDWLRKYRAGEEIPIDRAHVVADEIDATLKLHRLSTQQQLEQSTTGKCPACNHPEGGHWSWCVETLHATTGKEDCERDVAARLTQAEAEALVAPSERSRAAERSALAKIVAAFPEGPELEGDATDA